LLIPGRLQTGGKDRRDVLERDEQICVLVRHNSMHKQSGVGFGLAGVTTLTIYSDFTYSGAHPIPDTKAALAASCVLNTPSSSPGPFPHYDLHPAVWSSTDVFWKVITVGYGAPADYAIHWLLGGVTLGSDEVESLKRLANARATSISRAYACTTPAGGGPATFSPRTIYPLIEATERVGTNYLLGCAVAAICAPLAINRRLAGAAPGISYLFHASLLKSAHTAGAPAIINYAGKGNIDFLAFDENFQVHVIEAKGSGEGMDYGAIGRGLEQCRQVISVALGGGAPVIPRTTNVSMSYVGAKPVPGAPPGSSVRCAIFGTAVGAPPAPAPLILPPQLAVLIALQALGAWIFMRAARQFAFNGDWSRFQFDLDLSTDRPLVVAARNDIRALVEETYGQIQQQRQIEVKQNPNRQRAVLLGQLEGLGRRVAQTLRAEVDPPEGMRYAALDPFVALQA
jgi:hypothetical protein